MTTPKHVIVVGAGVGGLATALHLLAAGVRVTVIEKASQPGGKMRSVQSVAGPVDAGPTVLTMRWVLDDLFRALGEDIANHVTLTQADILARHFWTDGTVLDLCADRAASTANVHDAFGALAAKEFVSFSERAETLFKAFDAPMMRTCEPSTAGLAKTVLRNPRLLHAMAPHKTLAGLLETTFSDPRLRQLFGRYATYVGGSPYQSPALLSLIWHAEESGVWAVKGGMNKLAQAMASLIDSRGGTLIYDTAVDTLDGQSVTAAGTRFDADAIVFNGDPRALSEGHLGAIARPVVSKSNVSPRSLSAHVMAFAAIPKGRDLTHHNLFFGDDPRDEFDPLDRGIDPTDPTLYVCAQDRGGGRTPDGLERFEIIMNAPACADDTNRNEQDATTCQTLIIDRLAHMGLTFSPEPGNTALTQPADFNRMFPASLGSLYGRSPHGMTAGLKRPTARTAVAGLYLAGGGTHPGAGVPMATLSGKHAAEAIIQDLGLT